MHIISPRAVSPLVIAGCIAVMSLGGTTSPAGATCRPSIPIPKTGDTAATYVFTYVACAKGTYVFTLVYLDGSPQKTHKRGDTRGRRTIKVTAVGRHTLKWSGSAGSGRYRGSMKLPSGKKVSSNGTLTVVCSRERKADSKDFPDC
jgi:hypothetical protein